MEAVTKYKSNDGAEFDTAEEAALHEGLLLRLEEIGKLIIRTSSGNDTKGVQNTKENIIKFKWEFRKLLQGYDPEIVERWDADERGLQGFIDDRLWKLYYSFLCVGNDNKSYGQPAFVTQVNRGESARFVCGFV